MSDHLGHVGPQGDSQQARERHHDAKLEADIRQGDLVTVSSVT